MILKDLCLFINIFQSLVNIRRQDMRKIISISLLVFLATVLTNGVESHKRKVPLDRGSYEVKHLHPKSTLELSEV